MASVVPMSHISIDHQDDMVSAAETSVAGSLRNRKSHCTACGSKDGTPKGKGKKEGACKSCGSSDTKESDEPDELSYGVEKPPPQPDHDIIVEVAFKGRKHGVYLNEKKIPLALGDLVVIEAERGTDAGRISAVGRTARRRIAVAYDNKEPLLRVVRKATPEDHRRCEDNRKAEAEALSVCKERVRSFHLDMKVIDCEWQFDHNRLTFYFTAPQQVDFRELIKDLASIFSVRIELRQISPREEARRVGGIGVCGLELCCTTHLSRFEYITIDHAKVQGLANNPNKLSGQCGRLKCCLLFEIDNYVSALKNYPPLESVIQTKDGNGKIFKIDIFRDEVHLYYDKSSSYGTLSLTELNVLRRAGKIAAPRRQVVGNEPETAKR